MRPFIRIVRIRLLAELSHLQVYHIFDHLWIPRRIRNERRYK